MKYQLLSKENTLKNILKECIKRREFTSIDIVNSLNLTKPTVNEALDILYEDDFITREDSKTGYIGRKAQIWKTTLDKKKSLAMDIDVNLIRIATVNMDGSFYSYKEYDYTINNSNFLEIVKHAVNDYRNNFIKSKDIKRLGISIPGNISFNRKNILYATNMGLSDINIRSLEENLNMEIFLENEANSAVLGEFFLSKELDKSNYLLVSISEFGVGGGQIVDGKLLKGSHRLAGEIGHFTIIIDGEQCSCGNKGCFERYASYDGLKKLMNKHKINLNRIEELFENNNKECEKVIEEYAKILGMGLRSLLAIYDSNRIILSGKIANYLDRILPYLTKEIFGKNNFYSQFNIRIVKSMLGDKSSLVGVGLINFFPYIYEDNVFK